MEVTEVIEVSKSRSKVYLDYEIAFVLYKGDLRLYHIKKGSILSQEDYDEIVTKVLPKRAKLRSMNLLKSRDYTEYQLRDKLKKGFYSPSIIDIAIDYVKSYQYINDASYCIRYISTYYEFRSKKRIEMDLLKKGVNKEFIAEAYNHVQDEYEDLLKNNVENSEENHRENHIEIKQIEEYIKKKKYNRDIATKQEKEKMYGFLLRKGYAMDIIRKTIGEYFYE